MARGTHITMPSGKGRSTKISIAFSSAEFKEINAFAYKNHLSFAASVRFLIWGNKE